MKKRILFELLIAGILLFVSCSHGTDPSNEPENNMPHFNEIKITASNNYENDLTTSFTVEFGKHSQDTTEQPMEYQIEYYLFKTSNPYTASKDYFKYPADGKVTVSGINTGNTYKVILKARKVNKPEDVYSTDVKSVKTKVTDNFDYYLSSKFTSSRNVFNWGLLNSSFIPNKYIKVDVSGLYNYSSAKILITNADTNSQLSFSSVLENMGHFNICAYTPNGTSISSFNPITNSKDFSMNPADKLAEKYGNDILDSYVYNDCLYLGPVRQYENQYNEELTADYKVGFTFVAGN